MVMGKDINLSINGLGIIMYSDFAVKEIKEGDNYLEKNYWQPADVAKHVTKGTIVGFCTGSPGLYKLKFYEGYPNDHSAYEFVIRLGIEVRDNIIHFRDLYDLFEWKSECPEQQSFKVENGFYHITLCTNIPESGIIGDNQDINLFFNKMEKMPELRYVGVPELCY